MKAKSKPYLLRFANKNNLILIIFLQTTFKFELIEELKFVIKFSGSVKPVNRVQKQEGSLENLAEVAEGKDEIRSLRSIRSGRSTDTRRTHHSHSSRHSSRSLSVAFAKRREYS